MISVIMAVNRFDDYVEYSIQSILNQTLTNFEFIIVANGIEYVTISEKLNLLYKNDERVKIYSSPIGQLAFALNLAISKSTYGILARMDSDDIAYPDRLEKQYNYLIHNGLDLVGTAINIIDEKGLSVTIRKFPVNKKINKMIAFKNCFAHPSIMFRKELILKFRGYSGGFNSEDYDLWLRMAPTKPKWDNMNEPLLNYRVHSNSTQKSRLAYAECAAYSLRQFLMNKTLSNFLSLILHFLKALIK